MARDFRLPDLGEGLTEAEIVKVLVREGDVIAEDAPLLEVETDKATVEIPSPMAGRVEKVHVEPNQTVKVGQVLVTFADASSASGGGGAPPGLDSSLAREPAPARPWPGGSATPPGGNGPVPATPATRRLARELGVDLHRVPATGPGGRVTDDDVRAGAGGGAPAATQAQAPRAARAEPAAPAAPGKPLATHVTEPPLPNFEQWGAVERQPLSHLRRTIAERMTLSATVIPHVTHFDRADITELDAIIQRNLEAVKARGVTLTLTAFLLKAAAQALGEHPTFNATLDTAAGQLIVKRYVHLGVAVGADGARFASAIIRRLERPELLLGL